MQKVRVGIVGVGGIAKWHIRGYQRCEGIDVVAACDVRPEALAEVREAFDIQHTYADYCEMLAKEPLDLISVCTPNDMHYPVTMAAIERGLAVFCEKPLALTFAQAREMTKAAAEAGVRTGVNFAHRITPASRFAREIVGSGVLGNIYRVAAVYAAGWPRYAERPFTWRNDAARAGFGGMGDMGSHIMDMMLWWLDTDVSSLAAHARTFVPEREDPVSGERVQVTTEDQGSLLLQYGNGAMGYLCGSYVFTGRGYDQRAEVYGSEGGLMYDQQRPYELQLWLPEEQFAMAVCQIGPITRCWCLSACMARMARDRAALSRRLPSRCKPASQTIWFPPLRMACACKRCWRPALARQLRGRGWICRCR